MSPKLSLLFIILVSLIFQAITLDTQANQDTLVVQWNEAAMQAIANVGYGFTITSRISSILHTSMFNAWAPYDSMAVSAQVNTFSRRPKAQRTLANKQTAVSYAAYVALTTLLPSQKSIFDQVMLDNGYDTQVLDTDPNTAAGIGVLAARELLQIRENDGSNQLGDLNPSNKPYSEPILLPGYVPYKYINTVDTLNDINYWQPQRNPDGTSQTFLTPQWGEITPFALTSGSQFRPKKGPLTTKNYAKFVAQAQKVYDISKTLTEEQKVIAKFWSGQLFPNPSPWDRIAQFISRRDLHTLDDDVKLFFAFSNALFDAGITAWNTQRYYNSVRPITVINKLIDPNWKALSNVSPHPDYISGTSTPAGAAAEILKKFTCSDYFGDSYSDPTTGVTLSWKTFSEASSQVVVSRVYAGMHFELAASVGEKVGRRVAGAVWKKAKDYIEGNIRF